MASTDDWRSSLTALERYENIQRLQKALTDAQLKQSAFAFENDAYKSSTTREEYDASCQVNTGHAGANIPQIQQPPESDGIDPVDAERGVRIGQYQNCQYIASGVTAEVYRFEDRALKVIVETTNIVPHSPSREVKILGLLKRPCIPMLETFRDQEQRLVLAFPYMPLTLGDLIDRGPLTKLQIKCLFRDLMNALEQIHSLGIIHRDIKPSALLLASSDGPAYLSDFGTAWHPMLSAAVEPADGKVLDIGTGPYRAPEVLFGNRSYGTSVDMWGAGAMLAECCRPTANPLFESRPVHEDGNQLGLILSIFKTLGSPTRETWSEAANFRTPPFDMYRVFEVRSWEEILPDVEPDWRDLIASMVRYDSSRITATQVLAHRCFAME